ncbi:hypothetical protein KM043_001524 [Ampulex compressa]|nr:hypothetical protein KM043_001524 [Ampulex compressa]
MLRPVFALSLCLNLGLLRCCSGVKVDGLNGSAIGEYGSTNESRLANFTYALKSPSNRTAVLRFGLSSDSGDSARVDCFGLGTTVAKTLEWFFASKPNGSGALEVEFLLSSRRQPQRVKVFIGRQFGLEWTDFALERRTVFIVHGFLSHGNEGWIADLERAYLEWEDANIVVVDWSAGGNTWNYYRAAVNTKVVGQQIASFLEHARNATSSSPRGGSAAAARGPIHFVGHSLGAHICGFAAREWKRRQTEWRVERVTGLDPAQPCFRNADPSVHLHKSDAPFVDVIHTNGRLLSNIGLGIPEPVGHVDFYPNGGKVQPGCAPSNASHFGYLPIAPAAIRQAICSHGRSYVYLTESLVSAVNKNCTFWAQHWDLTFRSLYQSTAEACDRRACTEMGINAEKYSHRGTFFAVTAGTAPYCVNGTELFEEITRQLRADFVDETED